MKLIVLLALSFSVASSTPVRQEQERIEQEAELIPTDIDRRPTSTNPNRRTIIIRPLDLGNLFPADHPLFGTGNRRDIFGSPSFVDVPARRPESSPSTPSNGDDPLKKIFDDMFNLQRDILRSFFNKPRTESQGPAVAPRDPFIPEQKPETFFPDSRPQSSGGSGSTILDTIFGGIPEMKDFLGPNRGSFPTFSELPDNYDNSTYREEEVDGQVVRVNETIRKKTHPFGHSVFHFKVYQLGPDGVVQEVDTSSSPNGGGSIDIPAVRPEVPDTPNREFPISTINEPDTEGSQPAFKEDFGPIVNRGEGHEEQIPLSIGLPTAVDEAENVI